MSRPLLLLLTLTAASWLCLMLFQVDDGNPLHPAPVEPVRDQTHATLGQEQVLVTAPQLKPSLRKDVGGSSGFTTRRWRMGQSDSSTKIAVGGYFRGKLPKAPRYVIRNIKELVYWLKLNDAQRERATRILAEAREALESLELVENRDGVSMRLLTRWATEEWVRVGVEARSDAGAWHEGLFTKSSELNKIHRETRAFENEAIPSMGESFIGATTRVRRKAHEKIADLLSPEQKTSWLNAVTVDSLPWAYGLTNLSGLSPMGDERRSLDDILAGFRAEIEEMRQETNKFAELARAQLRDDVHEAQ